MKRAGTLIAHGREWPLYERRGWIRGIGRVIRLFLSPKDQVEKERLDSKALKRPGTVHRLD